jgi:hypothetical protein
LHNICWQRPPTGSVAHIAVRYPLYAVTESARHSLRLSVQHKQAKVDELGGDWHHLVPWGTAAMLVAKHGMQGNDFEIYEGLPI